jgi:hypothetical protein
MFPCLSATTDLIKYTLFTNAAVFMASCIHKLRYRHLQTTLHHTSHKNLYLISSARSTTSRSLNEMNDNLSWALLLTVCIKHRHITMGRKFHRLLAFGMPTITIYFLNIHNYYLGHHRKVQHLLQ